MKVKPLSSTSLQALQQFSELPDCARVRLPVVCLLFGISNATAWRWVHSGRLPEAHKVLGVTYWTVGDLRECLANSPPSKPVPVSDPVSRYPAEP
jgi:hypothetical protein